MTSNPQSIAATIAQPREHLPRGEDFLLFSPPRQAYGYRNVDKLFATRVIRRGAERIELPRGPEISPRYERDGALVDVGSFMDRNDVAGLLVIKNGQVVHERYGLGLQPHDRWTTMSMVKSMTALLVGAAVHDGAIASIDDRVVRYLPSLIGSGYENVTVRHLLTMSSGVAWTEDYTDKESDVGRYSRSLGNKVPGGVLAMMQGLRPAHPPGTAWHYNTGDTYLLGALVSAAVGQTLADYMSDRIWKPCGMEFDGYYTLESDGGQEIGGSRAGMALRDLGRIGKFVLDDGLVGTRRVLPEGWVDHAGRRAFSIPATFESASRRALGLTGYGFSWWLTDDGGMMAMGHSGQRLYVHRAERLVVVNLAVYPEPHYASAEAHNRDSELRGLIDAIRAAS
ncbi:serine hydrolase [Variovorax rhizosphaerae]|uniref:Serine hydrolase n=1 Tax=Variovorax rhizosphaerae TaxID=1836200 RepID=A0ABU8WV56_9BURK